MPEWTPEAIQQWLVSRLYSLYMKKPRAWEQFAKSYEEEAETGKPPFDDI